MKYFVYTKLQGDNWETDAKVTYPSLADAMRKIEELYNGPLGSSCMYEVHDDENGVVRGNGEILKWLGRGIKRPKTKGHRRVTNIKPPKPALATAIPFPEVDKMLREMYHVAFGHAINPAYKRTYRVEEAIAKIHKDYNERL